LFKVFAATFCVFVSGLKFDRLLKINSHPDAGGDPWSVVLKHHWIPACAGMTCQGLAGPVGVFQQAAKCERYSRDYVPQAFAEFQLQFCWVGPS
jgi:hypothetical protein